MKRKKCKIPIVKAEQVAESDEKGSDDVLGDKMAMGLNWKSRPWRGPGIGTPNNVALSGAGLLQIPSRDIQMYSRGIFQRYGAAIPPEPSK